MSLLTLSPTLRAPVARRTCTAAFSSTAFARNRRDPDAKLLPEFFNSLIDNAAGAESSKVADTAQSLQNSAAPADAAASLLQDGPPAAPADSWPKTGTHTNPMREAKTSESLGRVRPMYAVSVKATRNNSLVTFARPNGSQLVTLTGGKLGFKKSNRNSYEAGYQCAVGIIEAMEKEMERTDFEWALYLNGFGQGRDAMLTALTTSVGEKVKTQLKYITDRTPLKIGGTRGQKTRRV